MSLFQSRAYLDDRTSQIKFYKICVSGLGSLVGIGAVVAAIVQLGVYIFWDLSLSCSVGSTPVFVNYLVSAPSKE